MERATEAKTAVEETQRELRRLREESGQVHVPRFFAQNKEGRWIPRFAYVNFHRRHTRPCTNSLAAHCRIPTDPVEAETAVQSWIWSSPATAPAS